MEEEAKRESDSDSSEVDEYTFAREDNTRERIGSKKSGEVSLSAPASPIPSESDYYKNRAREEKRKTKKYRAAVREHRRAIKELQIIVQQLQKDLDKVRLDNANMHHLQKRGSKNV
eukprot:TRINITY_DN2792_c0_g1_i1.p2 TRINITY_DN2792_c0_g1~~TRINITY_DN2792_c0_g1_i1.p2  ORF type:complete len:124 (+),score=24.93 TRINITY_DN2792_c0_g1_i1:25-372(+)